MNHIKIFNSEKSLFAKILSVSLILVISICSILGNTLSTSALADVTVIVNGQEVKSGLILDSRTYVPLRSICETLDLEVEWYAEDQSITIYDKEYTVVVYMLVGNCYITRQKESDNWEVETFANDLPPRIVNGTTYVPLRALSLSFDMDIYWDNDTKTASIYYYSDTSGIETYETFGSDNAVAAEVNTGVYYDVLANICGGTPKVYQDRTLSSSEYSYYRSLYDDVYVDNYDGIYYLNLTDMDNDGTEELIFAYAQGMLTVISDNITPVGKYYIYTIENGKAVKLYESDSVFLSSVNGSSTPGISYADGTNYFITTYTGIEGGFALSYSIYYKNGSSVDMLLNLYCESSGAGSEEYYITTNGCDKAISESLFCSEALRYMDSADYKELSGTSYESLPLFTPHYVIERLYGQQRN
ncbi:MAG: copper amine oxidase N-terminal domain-containing protein [Clostridiales bacterium]|nr:copper amine oxidase N-terminal domain-containing protein [Clostridiales bacterium]